MLNTYQVRYSFVAFDRRLRIDSTKAPWGSPRALDIETHSAAVSIAGILVSDSIRYASTFELY